MQGIMNWILILTFLINFILAGAMGYMISMIRALQIILHQPMLKIVMPGHITMFFSILIPIVMFDVLDSGWTTEAVLDFDYDTQDELASDMTA